MRRKVTCTATTRTGEVAALLLAQLDLAELVVLDGPPGLAEDLAAAAGPQGYEPRVRAGGWADASGSELVVLDVASDAAAHELAARCAGAIVVVATGSPVPDVERLLAATCFPRGRLFGIEAPAPGPIAAAAHAVQAADAILRDRGRVLACAVQCLADDGGDDGVRVCDVEIGASGVARFA